MKQIMIGIVCIGVIFTFSAGLHAETITMGYFEHRPHMMTAEDGTAHGATITYFEMMAEKMGYEVEWVGPLPTGRMLKMIDDGELDGHPQAIPGMSEIQDQQYFGEQSFFQSKPVFMVRKENPLQAITTIEDVEGYRVGWVQHVRASQFVFEHQTHFKMDLIAANETMWDRNLQKLLADRVDAVHELNQFTLAYVAAQMGIGDKVKTLLLPEPPMPVYIVFSKHSPKGKQLLEAYNQVQAEAGFGHEDYMTLIQAEMEAVSQE